MSKSLIACQTMSVKDTNEDSCCIIHNNVVPFSGVIVADGIGSHKHSDMASALVIEYLKETLENLSVIDTGDLNEIFARCRLNLIDCAKTHFGTEFTNLNTESSLSTTVICALETEKAFYIIYLGNGSAWHIRGSYNQFSNSRYLPWNAINLLNPHCLEENGKPALYKYISINQVNTCPDIIKINKQSGSPGEWIMISTDGIYSYDSVTIGRDDENKVWISGEVTMEIFFQSISKMFSGVTNELTSSTLNDALTGYLQELKDKRLMTDDCSVGVIMPPAVVDYQASIKINSLE